MILKSCTTTALRQLCVAAADQYLQVQRRQLLSLLPWVAFVLLDGPGRLTALPIRHAGEPQVRVQRAAFHVSLDGGRVGVRREHLLDQVGFLWRFGGPVSLRELVLSLSFSLQVEREGRQGLSRRCRCNLLLQSHSNRHFGWVWQQRQTRPLSQTRLTASTGASPARLRANHVSQGGRFVLIMTQTPWESRRSGTEGSQLSEPTKAVCCRNVLWFDSKIRHHCCKIIREDSVFQPFWSHSTVLHIYI